MVHIQDIHNAKQLEPHWGYVDRVVPCANDKGSCEYLDQVYYGHDRSIFYSWILWVVIGGVLLLWLTIRLLAPRNGFSKRTDTESGERVRPNILARLYGACNALRRKYLLRESMPRIFGNISRLQIFILAIVSAYLLIFSFVGFKFKNWHTPIKNSTKKNIRSTLGPWSDRVGILAYAITPFSVALASRESALSVVTGIPYQHFNFLHRWTGRIIYVQGVLHTIAWTIIEAKLYQPQPYVYRTFIAQQYMIFGCVAMLLLSFLFVFSLRPVIRWTGYEFFRKTHYVVAVLYIGACWGHWYQLWCWMAASLAIWGIDRAVRFLRVLWIHLGKKDPVKGFGFHSAQAEITSFSDDEAVVTRLDLEFPHQPWATGQHFHLTFPDLTIWQSHPMTPLSLPSLSKVQRHTYIIRGMKGETARLAAIGKVGDNGNKLEKITTPVILSGPSGGAVFRRAGSNTPANVLAVAGGTGVSFALPIVNEAIQRAEAVGGAIQLVWVVRKSQNLLWIANELSELRRKLQDSKIDLAIKIYVTRDSRSSSCESLEQTIEDAEKSKEMSTSISAHPSGVESLAREESGFSVEYLNGCHPDFDHEGDTNIIDSWLARGKAHGGSYHVFASGPSALGTDLRVAIARRNNPGAVWKGDSSGDIEYYWDDRFA